MHFYMTLQVVLHGFEHFYFYLFLFEHRRSVDANVCQTTLQGNSMPGKLYRSVLLQQKVFLGLMAIYNKFGRLLSDYRG